MPALSPVASMVCSTIAHSNLTYSLSMHRPNFDLTDVDLGCRNKRADFIFKAQPSLSNFSFSTFSFSTTALVEKCTLSLPTLSLLLRCSRASLRSLAQVRLCLHHSLKRATPVLTFDATAPDADPIALATVKQQFINAKIVPVRGLRVA